MHEESILFVCAPCLRYRLVQIKVSNASGFYSRTIASPLIPHNSTRFRPIPCNGIFQYYGRNSDELLEMRICSFYLHNLRRLKIFQKCFLYKFHKFSVNYKKDNPQFGNPNVKNFRMLSIFLM